MEAALDRIQFKYSLTDRQRKLLQFSFIGIIYDSTKFLMLFIFFACIEQVPLFLFDTFILILLRSNQGGMHLKHYSTCFIFSFIYLFSSVCILPALFSSTSQLYGLCILFICILTNYFIGPQKNTHIYVYLKENNNILKSKRKNVYICFTYMLLFFIFSDISLFQDGIWVFVLHTTQIVLSQIIKMCRKETKNV